MSQEVRHLLQTKYEHLRDTGSTTSTIYSPFSVVLVVRQGKDVLKNPFDYMTEQKWRNTIKILNGTIAEIIDLLKRITSKSDDSVVSTSKMHQFVTAYFLEPLTYVSHNLLVLERIGNTPNVRLNQWHFGVLSTNVDAPQYILKDDRFRRFL